MAWKAGIIEQLSIALTAIGGAWIAIFKYMGLSKAFEQQKQENATFQKGVNATMTAQNLKIEQVEKDVSKMNIDVKDEFTLHRDYIHDNYMDETTVRAEFKRLEIARLDMYNRIDKKIDNRFDGLDSKIDKLDGILTDERTREIEDLRRQLRNKE